MDDDDLLDKRDRLADRLPDSMEEKNKQGRMKYGDSWVESHPDHPLRRMEEEFMEFRQAVEHYNDEEMAVEELADIVNYGLMFLVLHGEYWGDE